MEETLNNHRKIDPRNGFCSATRIFHSLRPPVPLPPPSQPLSITQYALTSLHRSAAASSEATTFLINAFTGDRLSYSDFLFQVRALTSSLRARFPSLSKGQVAFILSPPSFHVPVLYFSLISIGVVVSPANPISTQSELTHLIGLVRPTIAFATSSVSNKLPSLPLGTVLIDSPLFFSMVTVSPNQKQISDKFDQVKVNQSDLAVILYSSGTTGRVKGVELTHRNLLAVLIPLHENRIANEEEVSVAHQVSLFMLPLFHVFGFFMLFRAVTSGETLVLMERFDFEKMLAAIEKYRITFMPVSPPLVVAMAKSELVEKYNLSSLERLGCGGAPLGKDISERFTARFPNALIVQGYGMTETGGGGTRMLGPDETEKYGSAGRLFENMEAKIVDPTTGQALLPGQQGELWLRGPLIMKGYVGDDEATAATMDSDGWLKTGDLCYFDSDGFLYIVDRLKELIKYKAYQVPPAELEHLLQSIPEVADAAVIPYPDEDAGQIPMACIVRKPGAFITEAQIMDFIAKQVAPYKRIRRVAFVDSIPKSAAGKILRRELVNHVVSGISARL